MKATITKIIKPGKIYKVRVLINDQKFDALESFSKTLQRVIADKNFIQKKIDENEAQGGDTLEDLKKKFNELQKVLYRNELWTEEQSAQFITVKNALVELSHSQRVNEENVRILESNQKSLEADIKKFEKLEEDREFTAFPKEVTDYTIGQEVDIIFDGYNTAKDVVIVNFPPYGASERVEDNELTNTPSFLYNRLVEGNTVHWGLKYYRGRIAGKNGEDFICNIPLEPHQKETWDNCRELTVPGQIESYEIGDYVLIDISKDGAALILGYWQEPKKRLVRSGTFFDFKKEKNWGLSLRNEFFNPPFQEENTHIWDPVLQTNIFSGLSGWRRGSRNIQWWKRWLEPIPTGPYTHQLVRHTQTTRDQQGENVLSQLFYYEFWAENTWITKSQMNNGQRDTSPYLYRYAYKTNPTGNTLTTVNSNSTFIETLRQDFKNFALQEVADFVTGGGDINDIFHGSFNDVYEYIDDLFAPYNTSFETRYFLPYLFQSLLYGYHTGDHIPTINPPNVPPSQAQIDAAYLAESRFQKYSTLNFSIGQIIPANTFPGQTQKGIVNEKFFDDSDQIIDSQTKRLKHLETMKIEYLTEAP